MAFEDTLNAVRVPQPRGRPRTRPAALAGDKGYSFAHVRSVLRRRGIRAVIPYRSNQRRHGPDTFDREAYRERNIVERCVGWLKECRRIATRYEKLAVNFLTMLKVAIIERHLRMAFLNRT